MRKIYILFCLVSIALTRLSGQTVTVYPGDANNSRKCNHVDLLQIGLNFGSMGTSRNFIPNINWGPQSGLPWSGPVGIDRAYSDCDGNGVVDRNDALAIDLNFGDSIPGTVSIPDTNSFGPSSAPHLRVNIIQDSISVPISGQVTVTLAIELGSGTIPVDSIYGYAYTLDFDPVIVDDVSFTFSPGNFATDSAALTFIRIDTVLGKIYVAATNIDHVNRLGSGVISTIGIVMDDDIRIASAGYLFMQPTSFVAYTASATLVPVFPQGDSLKVLTGLQELRLDGIEIYPNPANDRIEVRSSNYVMTGLLLTDMEGRLLLDAPHPDSNFAILHTDQLPAGCYFLEVHARERVLRQKLIIQ